jgi:orotidine-5'-phosphate decarboxylase
MLVDRLVEAIRTKDSTCVVGLDPSIERIPNDFLSKYRIDAQNPHETLGTVITDYCRLIIDAVADIVPAVKPQIAYFEVFGVPGLRALENAVAYSRSRGLFVILDAKRNDIGETASAYAQAYLGSKRQAAGIDVDFMTVNPYMGVDTLDPFVNACAEMDKGIFVLVKTSNPGSKDVQDLPTGNRRVYDHVSDIVSAQARKIVGKTGYSAIGAVVGATYPDAARTIRQQLRTSFFLVPGFGAQGGTVADTEQFFNGDGLGALISASRSVIYPTDDDIRRYGGLLNSIRQNALHMTESVNSLRPK